MIIIPARLNSTRFDKKILKEIDGIPMFIKTALSASEIDDVVIGVDDEDVKNIAKKYNLEAILTDKNHKSGTDRINEVANKLNLGENEIIINLQADEPFFEQSNIEIFKNFADKKIAKENKFMASLYKIVSIEEADDANLVKVITNCDEDALYFSRSLIPYPRTKLDIFKAHIGIYAYSVKNLKEFCSFKNSFLEDIEKLEQLRAIENKKTISMLEIKTNSVGVDTLKDYLRVISKNS